VVLDAMQPMLLRIVKDVIATGTNTEIVAEAVSAEALPDVIRSCRPDVVVLGGARTSELSSDQLVALLRGDATPLRIIALSDGSRRTLLHELRPHVMVIEQLSAQSLLSAITGGANEPEGRRDG
jgi:chemotaxis response regulator CheB